MSAPLRLGFKASKGKRLNAVQYRLDGKRLRIARKARTVSLTPARLRPGRHVLSLRVARRGGAVRTLNVRIRAIRG